MVASKEGIMIVVYEELGLDDKGREYVKHREIHRPSKEEKIKTKMFVKEHKLLFKKIKLEMKLLKKELKGKVANVKN